MNKVFSIKRFNLLVKREVRLKKSFYLISILGTMVAMFGVILITMGTDRNYRNWDLENNLVLFLTLMGIFGVIFTGTSFPYLRSKNKTMEYLLIPNSTIEKYVFEVVFRIIALLVLFPVMYWITSNLAGITFNAFTADYYDLSYNFWDPIREIYNEVDYKEAVISILALIIFLASVPFIGAVYFSKHPIFKTAIFIAVFFGVALFYGWILDQMIGFTETRGFEPDISANAAFNLLSGFIGLSTIVLHVSAFYRLKEKEI